MSISNRFTRLSAAGAAALALGLALPAMAKASVVCQDLPAVYAAPDVVLTSAALVPAVPGATPEYCDVRGTINGHIKFAVFLPSDWNERFQMVGNGGKAGTISLSDMRTAVAGHFATASTDTGHDANSPTEGGSRFGNDALFGKEREIDFGWRAVHLTAVTAKDVIGTYYAKRLRYSYWNGCSTGGRQGLMEAQRFPNDFDGYAIGAPVYFYTRQQMSAPAYLRPLYRHIPPASPADGPVLSAAKRDMVGAAVYKRCDALDGVTDGQLRNPLKCDFDPARDIPACPVGTSGPTCLTSSELAALQEIYAGHEPFVPAEPKGSENIPGGWSSWLLPNSPTGTPLLHSVIADAFEWLMFKPDRPGFDYLTQFDWSTDPYEMKEAERIFNATDPDLRAVMRKGRKIVMYHGFSDPGANPLRTIRYRQAVIDFLATQPGVADAESAVDGFMRLYMVPGMGHCGGGTGHTSVDWITPLEHWVEDGLAPEAIIGNKPGTTSTRPHCPYPQEAVYQGGDANQAASFACMKVD